MRVIKRNGRAEEFDSSKIKTSLANTSDSINEPLTQGDLNSITNEVADKIKSRYKNEITYIQIRDLIIENLKNRAFFNIVKAYRNSNGLKKNQI
ncbi:ATP cone domain-containing protein [Clostridium polynesiense]|uniref:ATP cone domain-containing protein n=1 Tax=Clostridium polynesiense TaxID=1325933 RepID=UPI00058E92A9|nr:ATP cone domain-containing protein [Clostridium polynesiense]